MGHAKQIPLIVANEKHYHLERSIPEPPILGPHNESLFLPSQEPTPYRSPYSSRFQFGQFHAADSAKRTTGKLTMNDLEKLLIERECEALSIAYARHVDYHDYDAFSDLFTEHGHLDAGGAIDGRENIRQTMSTRPDKLRSRHILTNIFIEVQDADTANGVSYLTLYRHVGPESLKSEAVVFDAPAAVGHYTDRFERTIDGWRIKSRVLEFAFKNPQKF